MIMAITIGILIAGGVYLVLQRGMVRIVLGMTLISHGANLIILAAGIGAWRGEPFGGRPLGSMADPLPQAFVLTAIVITMATTAFMLMLAAIGRSDDTALIENPDTYSPLDTRGRGAALAPEGSRRAVRLSSLEEEQHHADMTAKAQEDMDSPVGYRVRHDHPKAAEQSSKTKTTRKEER